MNVGGRRYGSPGRAGLLAVLVVLAGCADGDRAGRDTASDTAFRPGAAASDTTVRIYFSRGDSVVPVDRVVRAAGAGLEASLRHLLRGPTVAERRAGLTSWFSDSTAGALRSVTVVDGAAIIDFEDLRPFIPGASTSAGSALLLRELNATVFETPSVRTVEYRMNGSCAKFYEWLQYGCRTASRP